MLSLINPGSLRRTWRSKERHVWMNRISWPARRHSPPCVWFILCFYITFPDWYVWMLLRETVASCLEGDGGVLSDLLCQAAAFAPGPHICRLTHPQCFWVIAQPKSRYIKQGCEHVILRAIFCHFICPLKKSVVELSQVCVCVCAHGVCRDALEFFSSPFGN